MCRSVMGLVNTRDEAELIVADLRGVGFALPDLSFVCPVAGGAEKLELLAGGSGVVLAGAEPLLAAGPLMTALSATAANAAVGGIAGALVDWGLPEPQARLYRDCVSDGHILLAVKVRSREAERDAETVLKRAGAHDVVSARAA